MAKSNDAWGIEVGSSALKAIRLTRSGDRVTVADYEVLPFKPILTTPDLNVAEAIQVQLDALLAKHDLRRSNVVLSVPGNMAFGRFAKLPPVEPKQVPKIVEFEARQQIPFPIEQVEWDYQVFQDDDNPDVEVGIFAITKERVMEYLSNFNAAGIQVESLTLSPLAVFNAFQYEASEGDEEPPGSVLIDIGTQSTDVVIVEGGRVWLRTLPLGGNDFTNALVRSFKLSFPKAEKLKLEARTSKYARQIFQAMRPVFADLVQEVQRSIGYYQSLNRDSKLEQIIGFGSTFRLPGLQKFLKQQLQMDVIRPDGFDRISIDGPRSAEFADHAVNLATAYGLALQGVGLQSVDCNIMPAAILHRRIWKAKQPWFAAAAALLLLAACLALGKSLIDANAFDAGLASVQGQVQSVTRQAQGFRTEFSDVANRSDARSRIENISRVLDYRDLWSDILDDVAQATTAGVTADPEFAVLLEPDYDKWPVDRRGAWPRVFVDEIEATYGPTYESVQNATVEDSTTRSARGYDPTMYEGGGGRFEDWGGGPGYDSGRTSSRGSSGSVDSLIDWRENHSISTFFDADNDDGESSEKGPTIRVLVRGTTSNDRASELLNDVVIGWLRDNADRPDHAYRIIVPESPIKALLPVTEETLLANPRTRAAMDRRSQARSSARTLPGTARSLPGAAQGLPGGFRDQFDDMNRRFDGRSAGGVTPVRSIIVDEPPYHRFEIEWFVQLKSPQQARVAEQFEPDSAPAEPTQPNPDEAPDDAQAQAANRPESQLASQGDTP
ncbi:MAG: type IV pilus assembly protein PilM [Planctomycetota bacterium]